jgi:hypothetical protein
VHFSHQRHVIVGKVDCKACHGDIAQRTTPPPAPLVTIRMQLCLDCHQAPAVELTESSLQALQGEDLPLDLLDVLPDFENKRFRSGAELLGAMDAIAGAPLADAERKRILGLLHPAPRVTTDCIACHR